MEIQAAFITKDLSNRRRNTDASENLQLRDFTANRIQAVKSLVEILMKEVELLENLAPDTERLLKNQKISLAESVNQYESELIRIALNQTKGHQKNAAKLLGTKTTTLNVKMKRYGIDPR